MCVSEREREGGRDAERERKRESSRLEYRPDAEGRTAQFNDDARTKYRHALGIGAWSQRCAPFARMATAMDASCDSGDRESAMSFAMELRRATAALQASIDAARSTDHVSLPADGPTTASDVVDYARRISYTTYAPAGYEPGAPLHGIMPPRRRRSTSARRTSRARRGGAGEGGGEAGARRGGGRGEESSHSGRDAPWRRSSSSSPTGNGQPWPAGIPPPPPGWNPAIRSPSEARR